MTFDLNAKYLELLALDKIRVDKYVHIVSWFCLYKGLQGSTM